MIDCNLNCMSKVHCRKDMVKFPSTSIHESSHVLGKSRSFRNRVFAQILYSSFTWCGHKHTICWASDNLCIIRGLQVVPNQITFNQTWRPLCNSRRLLCTPSLSPWTDTGPETVVSHHRPRQKVPTPFSQSVSAQDGAGIGLRVFCSFARTVPGSDTGRGQAPDFEALMSSGWWMGAN